MNIRHIVITLILTATGCAVGFFVGVRHGAVPPDPTAPSPEIVSKVLAAMDHYDFSKLDPMVRKDCTLQLWYAQQAAATSILRGDTGHEFRPIWMGRSPTTILEEQSDFMKRWLADRAEMEQKEHPQPEGVRGFPPESARDPVDGARIDWEDCLAPEDQSAIHQIWVGKHARSGEWMAYEHGKGVYKPDDSLLKRILEHEKVSESSSGDPFEPQK